MAQSIVIHALTDKRARIAGELIALQRRMQQTRADLATIDAAIRLFAHDVDPEAIVPIAPRRRLHHFEHGGVTRLCLEALRVANGVPVSAKDITLKVMQDRGLGSDNPAMTADFHRRIQFALNLLRKRGGAVRHGGFRNATFTLGEPIWMPPGSEMPDAL